MLEAIGHLYTALPWFIKIPAEFWFSLIILRGVIANDVTSWMEDKGIIKKGKGSIIYRWLDVSYAFATKFTGDPIRRSTICQHYGLQVQGKGHSAASVLDCGEDRCQMFSTSGNTSLAS